MNNSELDKLLRSAKTPRRDDTYWDEFPGTVTVSINRPVNSRAEINASPTHSLRLLVSWGLGIATACIVIGFSIGFWRGRESGLSVREIDFARKYYQEVAAMFPNQVQAIIFEQNGPRLVLADHANVPRSTPYYLKICASGGCEELITFSGQQVQFKGEKYEVLADGKGQIILLGKSRVLAETASSGPVRVEARPIGTVL